MNRRQQRECLFQVLFLHDFYPENELKVQSELTMQYLDQDEEKQIPTPEEAQKILVRAETIFPLFPALDEELQANMEGWRLPRCNRVDLTILRLALYEMKHEADIPFKVAVNEAVELAKKYGGEDSPAFVNGILAHLVKYNES